MTGHRPFSDLKKDWTPERRARSEAHQAKLAAEMADLERLCGELALSAEEIAAITDLEPSALVALAHRPDMTVSMLRALIAAMGGELRLTAAFPGRAVEIGLDQRDKGKGASLITPVAAKSSPG